MIQAVVFDLDDTLFPEWTFVKSGFQALDAWVLEQYGVGDFFKTAWILFERGDRGRIFNQTLDTLQISYQLSDIQELVQVYRQHAPQIQLHPDGKWVLEYFQGKLPLGLITDGYLVTQQNKVSALGIQSNFQVIVYSDLFGREHWKPSPTPYRTIMESLSCEGSGCVYIGDNPAKDFITAKQLGWKTVHLCRPDAEYQSPRVTNINRLLAVHNHK
jgi:putative hydrolase of the HAD superfamily